MKYIKMISIVACVAIFMGCANDTNSKISMSDNEIGLRNTSLSEENITLKDFSYISTPAGESALIERSFENAPPMIPHDVEGMMEITKDYNACLGCHSPEMAELTNSTSVPASHTYDLVHDKKLGEVVADSRYNCTACHTPQANVAPIVENRFKADFRNEIDKTKSNLLDVLDEGVK